jgi:hypothetical protein
VEILTLGTLVGNGDCEIWPNLLLQSIGWGTFTEVDQIVVSSGVAGLAFDALASSFRTYILGKPLRIRPELSDRQLEVTADSSHHIAGYIRSTALDHT